MSIRLNFLSILYEKINFFLFYTFIFTTYISLFILHIYSIKYSFFYYFLLFSSHSSQALPISLSRTNSHHQATNLHHHQLIRPYRPTYPKPHSTQKKAKSTKILPFNPNESQINLIQLETH